MVKKDTGHIECSNGTGKSRESEPDIVEDSTTEENTSIANDDDDEDFWGVSPVGEFNIDGLDLALALEATRWLENERQAVNVDDDESSFEERTVDSLILARQRFAKNRLEACMPESKNRRRRCRLRRRRSCSPPVDPGLQSLVLNQVRERLSDFLEDSRRRRRTLKKHDSLELLRDRNPSLIHNGGDETDNENDYREVRPFLLHRDSLELTRERLPHLILGENDERRVRRVMRTRDSLELTRERLPHLVIVRDDSFEEVDADECISDEESSVEGEINQDVPTPKWDPDFDPYGTEVDSLVLTRKRLQSRAVSENSFESVKVAEEAPHKSIHGHVVRLDDPLLRSAGPNSGGFNCAA